MSDFWVLLGTDYSGKSTVLEQLARRAGRLLPVSYDRNLLPEEYAPLAGLPAALPGALHRADRAAPEFALSLLHVAVAYQQERVRLAPCGRTPLLDSSYYKIAAKCRLLGLDCGRFLPLWESMPQPAGVVFLDCDPLAAWQRSDRGARLNPLETYGGRTGGSRGGESSWRSFARFQQDLRGALIDAVSHLPVSHISAQDDVEATVTAVERAVKD